MKKIFTVSALALAFVFLSGCGNKNQEQNQNQNQAQEIQQEQAKNENAGDENSFMGSLKDLLNVGKTLKCEGQYEDGDFQGIYETYVSGEKVRSDIVVNMAGGDRINSHAIITDGWMYSWQDGSDKGMKININEMNQEPNDQSDDNQSSAQIQAMGDAGKEMNFKCSPWTEDNSMFSLPEGVEFLDQAQMMNEIQTRSREMQEQGTNGDDGSAMPENLQAQQCAACEKNPNQATAEQCKKALNCAELK